MDGFAQLRGGAREHADRVDQPGLIHGSAALLALVSEGLIAGAMRTRSANEPIRQELLGFQVVQLLCGALGEQPFLMDLQKEILTEPLMDIDVPGLVRAAEDVKLDVEPGEIPLLRCVVVGGQLLDRAVLLAGGLERRHAVVVAAADESDVRPGGPQVADIDVSRHVGSGDVTHVQPAVGIGQGGGD